MRLAQLIVGIVFLGNYFDEGGFFHLVFGSMMSIQAVLNMGCFSSKGCSTPNYPEPNNRKNQDVEVEFEEVT